MGYISCDNCKHFNVPVNEQPCNDCIRTLETEKYWVNYTCEEEEPCATCLRDYDYSQREEREHNGKKAEDN